MAQHFSLTPEQLLEVEILSCAGQLKALPPPPAVAQLPHTGRNKKTHLSVALSMSQLCVAVFQGTWSVFSHNEINSAANCAAASGSSSRSGAARQRRSGTLSDLDLWSACTHFAFTFFIAFVSLNMKRCSIDAPYRHLDESVPEDLLKFSVYFAEPDLS